ncbi:MAG: hypothetical protein SO253_04725 [Bacilli bacterium]|nr:hypothetical protein [Bacilli bacterium]
MKKVLIAKPKRPQVLEIQNIILIILSSAILFYLNILLCGIFVTVMVVFIVISILDFKDTPSAILYIDGQSLYYYHKRTLTKMKFKDIKSIERRKVKKREYMIIHHLSNEIIIEEIKALDYFDELNNLIIKKED